MSLRACARAHRESHPPPQIQSLHLVIIVVLQTNVPESGKYAVTALTATHAFMPTCVTRQAGIVYGHTASSWGVAGGRPRPGGPAGRRAGANVLLCGATSNRPGSEHMRAWFVPRRTLWLVRLGAIPIGDVLRFSFRRRVNVLLRSAGPDSVPLGVFY